MKKRVILSAGGTGGHLFPAQSLAEALTDYEICFVGGGLSKNRYFNRDAFPFQEIQSATFTLSQPVKIVTGCGKIVAGIWQARKFIRSFKPNLVVGFGSFFTLPLLIAAAAERIPIILHEQNAIPGKVNRLFAPLARSIAITFPASRDYLKGRSLAKVIEVAFPMRHHAVVSKQLALEYFGLREDRQRPTILLFGGSQGASRLNTLFLEAIRQLPLLQILHFTGSEQGAEQAQQLYAQLGYPACVKVFEPRIDVAMQAADCAITRAGGATVSELTRYHLPALLIPFPFAAENHQEKNGDHFVSIVKGGRMYKESELDGCRFASLISQLIEKKEEFREQILLYQHKRSVLSLPDLIKQIVGK